MNRYFMSSITVLCLIIFSVSSQEVSTFTGEDVLLPCVFQNNDPVFTIFWRTKTDRNVYDILESKSDLSNQDPLFRDRVVAFPEEYVKGNFSILLKNAGKSDIGRYMCYIPKFNIQRQVDLVVTDKPIQPREEMDEKTVGGGGVSLSQNLSLLTFILIGHVAHRL